MAELPEELAVLFEEEVEDLRDTEDYAAVSLIYREYLTHLMNALSRSKALLNLGMPRE